jgi:predicted DNA-binding protein with PD1-like motif
MLRLDTGDVVPECIERFAEENRLSVGYVIFIGGIGGGNIVVGPRRSNEKPPQKMMLPINDAHEVLGVGIIAPGEDGKPILHIHAALGRSGNTISGCLQPGVATWLVGEVIVHEILGMNVARIRDEESGFLLLNVEPRLSPGESKAPDEVTFLATGPTKS